MLEKHEASARQMVCGMRARNFMAPEMAQGLGNVKYCSDNCLASGLTSLDIEIEKTILKLLQDRPAGATICPSEAARTLQPCETDDSWKVLMEPIRRAARRLAAPPGDRMASGRPAG